MSDPREEPWDGREVYCECGHLFRVPRSLRGGIANCARCGRAVTVDGGAEPLFWILLALGIGGVLGLAGLAGSAGGTSLGLVTLGIGAVILVVAVMAS